ncbi:hypothetical protein RP20_CCG020854 [Aedes albopictus]|nr:hypothetical protein RP20_CCG020854 [Aedes albopictus]
MNSNHSSFIHHLIDDIFEDTFTQKPSSILPWHIPEHFYRASKDLHHTESPTRKLSREPFWLEPLQPARFPDPSPEQPLRDTLLSTVIGLANFLAIKTLLIVSRRGGTVKRLRELTDRFHLIALDVSSCSSDDDGGSDNACAETIPNRCCHHRHRLESLSQLENVDLVHIKCDDDYEVEAFTEGILLHHPNYEAALERITQVGLKKLQRNEQVSSGDKVLLCYRSHPRDSCVNAFKILTV